jgi:hypothetical protein
MDVQTILPKPVKPVPKKDSRAKAQRKTKTGLIFLTPLRLGAKIILTNHKD